MPKYWMINDRSKGGTGPDVNWEGLTFCVSDKLPLTGIKNWRQVPRGNFQKLSVRDIHGAYFLTHGTIERMRNILRGRDRGVLENLGYTRGHACPRNN